MSKVTRVHSWWKRLAAHPAAPCPLQEAHLQDGAGHKPAYNLRTLCRALEYAASATPTYGLQRSLWDGFAMSFLTQLDPPSGARLERLMQQHLLGPGTSLKVGPEAGREGVCVRTALQVCCACSQAPLLHGLHSHALCPTPLPYPSAGAAARPAGAARL